jgi:hypothetical protein
MRMHGLKPAHLGHMQEYSVDTPGSQGFSLYARISIPHAHGEKEGKDASRSCFHRGSNSQTLVDATEVVPREMKGHGRFQVAVVKLSR